MKGLNKMGTNYYWYGIESSKCRCCGHTPDREVDHIGKSSVGWKFGFNAVEDHNGEVYIQTGNQWFEALRAGDAFGKTIENEYGDTITVDEFIVMVKDKQKRVDGSPAYTMALYELEHPSHYHIDNGEFIDAEGYRCRMKHIEFC